MHFIYILKCRDGSYYCGYTINLKNRLAMHNAKKASKYTRSRLPVKIVHVEKYRSQSGALKRECEIKTMTRKQKQALITPSSLSRVRGRAPKSAGFP